MKRQARLTRGRGKAWFKKKADDRPRAGSDLLAEAARTGDAVALVEIIEQSISEQEPLPEWIWRPLSQWLAEFVVMTAPETLRPQLARRPFLEWGKHYMRRYRDDVIRDHIEAIRVARGLTFKEAYEDASETFRGTLLAGSPDALAKAFQRAKHASLKRPFTLWEGRTADVLMKVRTKPATKSRHT